MSEPLRARKIDLPPVDPALCNGIRAMRVDRGRSYQQGPDGTIAVWDLDLAAFLLLNNVPLVNAWRDGSEFRIVYKTDEDAVRQLHVKFLQSEAGRFATVLKMLKKTVVSIGQRPPDQPR